MAQAGDWNRVLSALKVGDEVELMFESRGEKKAARVTVEKDSRLTIVPLERRAPKQEAMRAAWLGSRVK